MNNLLINDMNDCFKDLFVRPDYDHSTVQVSLTAPRGCQTGRWEIWDGDAVVSSGSFHCMPGEGINFFAPLENFKFWHVHSPYLYDFKMVCETSDGTVCKTLRFGMRKFHIEGTELFVNNEKFYIRGVIRGREAHDHPNLAGLSTYEFYAKYMRMMKLYGFNFIRFHSKIPPAECFQAADELGILIHVEMRKYFGKYQKERSKMADAGDLLNRDEWKEMVKQLRNNTSLMIYCMGNEITHPGLNPVCDEFYRMTKELDPTRFFLDTCAHGEFDRNSVDLDVQHMSYFFPFGHSYDMFENTQNWIISGSAKGVPMIEADDTDNWNWKVLRRVPSPRPVLAHEICHYVGLRDLGGLESKFDAHCPEKKPWWIGELKKMIRLKGHAAQYERMREASERFQSVCWKIGLEAARRSKVINGFHFLQFCDTDLYENSNGIVDCFDDQKGVDQTAFRRFNDDTVLLADLPRRTFYEDEKIEIMVMVSHFSFEITGIADFSFMLTGADGAATLAGGLKSVDLSERGRREISQIILKMPKTDTAKEFCLSMKLTAADGSYVIDNSWQLWVFPDRPAALPAFEADVLLDDLALQVRYPQIRRSNDAKLKIANRFSKELLDHVAAGGDAWVMYRVPVTRDRKVRAEKEKYYLPAVWDRFKGVIWDRGHNCGAFMRESGLFDRFPSDGFLNMQFLGLVDDADKIILDDFPVKLEPIMEGVDRAVRDRFDVFNFQLSELQPSYTLRKFAYLFELKVGQGRLFVSGFNFTGLNRNIPEASGMFEAIIRYMQSDDFSPSTEIAPERLADWLLEKGRGPIVKERRMTQYWQLDEEPLESRKYWDEALEYIGEEVKQEDLWKQIADDKLKMSVQQ